jgi:hypothetical protein
VRLTTKSTFLHVRILLNEGVVPLLQITSYTTLLSG